MQLKLAMYFISMTSLDCWTVNITHFSCTVGLQFFLLFLSYQDAIQLDSGEVETALFDAKMAN